ncbi:MAG TPA: hypothetical protein VK887_01450, partial [Pseudonocardiaceae bacterium]|nr:hypothetical protein [Pseudonocardiaceae bacterium]
RIGQDAVNLADPFVDFNRFDRVVVISNWPGFGGTGGGPYWWRVAEGVEMTVAGEGKRAMTLSVANEWQATGSGYGGPGFDEGASVVAHEIGHHLGVPVHYDDVRWFPGSRDAASPWDLMGFSPTLFHFIGWAKSAMGWLPAARVSTLGPPEGSDIDVTQRLRPQAVAMGSGIQLLRIPFTRGEPYRGYVVENRRRRVRVSCWSWRACS